MYLGIDLTSSEAKPSACAVLSGDGSLAYIGFETMDSEILGLAGRWRPRTVAIDAPLGLPRGMCCLEESCDCQSSSPSKGRVCEREMAARGIPLYFTTKRSIIKRMVYRGIAVAGALRRDGRQVLEVYPYASKVCLFGKPIPLKTKREGIMFMRERLMGLIPGLDGRSGELGHDLCDALIAAHTAYLHGLGRTEAVGVESEERIVVPDQCQSA